MKKLLFALLFTCPFLLAGCGEDTTTTGTNIIIPVTETANFEQGSLYSILKTKTNTTAWGVVTGASQSADDIVTVTFPSAQAENFTLRQGYYVDNAYGIALYSNSKETSIDKFNVSVKNRLGKEILNSNGYMFTVHKIFPYYNDSAAGTMPIPYTDNYIFYFNTATPSHTILFKQVVNEYDKYFGNGSISNISAKIPLYVRAYGFNNQNFDNATTYNNFTVDADSAELDYNGTMYPNCLNYKGSSDCAVKITNNSSAESSAVFYMHISNKYVDTAIKLQSTAQ
ncbi:MAG: hypothetical protein SPF17_07060 [Candidatus Mucispirillum faecigallinarum]|nr:hypothetical protein [Candidatus Mucispirillum faecigallinarum]